MILAMDLYMETIEVTRRARPSDAVVGLSRLLRERATDRGGVDPGEKFRNTNGVYRKLTNFLAEDPEYSGKGRV